MKKEYKNTLTSIAFPETKVRYEPTSVSEGSITSDLDYDVMVLHQRCPIKIVNAFFRHGGKCLICALNDGVELFFRSKWFYIPFVT